MAAESLFSDTNMVAMSLSWDTNMAAVTSCENTRILLTFDKCCLESIFFSYIPGCSEEPDHNNRQITQMNLHLMEKAKQQQFKK